MRVSERTMKRVLGLGFPALVVLSMQIPGRVTSAQPAPDAAIEARIAPLLAQMSLDEKLDMLSGTGFDTKPLPRLGIPKMAMSDGPVGVRSGPSSVFPASVALAASWNPELVQEVGAAIGREARAKGKNVLLGPCLNIHRVPHGGRNFESFGEDPYLAARMAVAFVRGVQAQKVIATVKHFACNNQEHERMTIDVKVDERALHEIYLPAFRAAVQEAGVWAVMGAYNRVLGEYACANRMLLTEILKQDWGFPGLVMSDWGAVHGVTPYVNAGLDLEMPGGAFLTKDNLRQAIAAGEVDEAAIDDKIRRMLRAMLSMGLFDPEQDPGAIDTPEHRALARRAAAEGIVLLKNSGPLLPLNRQRLRSVAVIGPNAAVARTGGGGSSYVTPIFAVSPLDGIKTKLGRHVLVKYAQGTVNAAEVTPIPSNVLVPPEGAGGQSGLLGEYFDNPDVTGAPVLKRVDAQVAFDWQNDGPGPGLKADGFSARWTGRLRPVTNGRYAIALRSDDGARLSIDQKVVIDNWGQHPLLTSTAIMELRAGRTYSVTLEYQEAVGMAAVTLGWKRLSGDPLKEAVEAAEHSEVALVFAGLSEALETEGADRASLALPSEQDALISAVAAANPNTIVVLNSGAALLLGDWVRAVPVVLQAWYPGQAGGDAIADILVGDVNPSGRMPTTFLKRWEDSPAYGNYPGKDGVVNYQEGIFVGYRHFDQKGLAVLAPFGHGLSYSSFSYHDLHIAPRSIHPGQKVAITFQLTNAGPVDGAEAVQLYVRDPESSLPRPVKELKGFQKVVLKKGETKEVRFELDEQALAFYDPSRKAWITEPGIFEAMIGASSIDIWLHGAFSLE